jgi:hypothetical protein
MSLPFVSGLIRVSPVTRLEGCSFLFGSSLVSFVFSCLDND